MRNEIVKMVPGTIKIFLKERSGFMNKRCTNPSCRRVFSTLYFTGCCPFCGKKYPQLVSNGDKGSFLAVRIEDYNGFKVRTIKIIRDCFGTDLRTAKQAADGIPHTVFLMKRADADQFTRELDKYGCTYTRSRAPRKKMREGILLQDSFL